MKASARNVPKLSLHDSYASNASRNAGSTAVISRATGRDRAQVSRWNRRQTRGPIHEMFRKVVALVERFHKAGANGFVMLGELMAMLYRARIYRDMKDAEVVVAYYELLNKHEPTAEMCEDVASRGRDLGEHRDALVKSGAADFQLAACTDELIGRRLDPREWSPQGHRIVTPIRRE